MSRFVLLVLSVILTPYLMPLVFWFWSCVQSEVKVLTAGALDVACLDLGADCSTDPLCDLGKGT